MKACVRSKLILSSVLVSGQQLTQVVTFGVAMRRNVERITFVFVGTAEWILVFILNWGGLHSYRQKMLIKVGYEVSVRDKAVLISRKGTLMQSDYQTLYQVENVDHHKVEKRHRTLKNI